MIQMRYNKLGKLEYRFQLFTVNADGVLCVSRETHWSDWKEPEPYKETSEARSPETNIEEKINKIQKELVNIFDQVLSKFKEIL